MCICNNITTCFCRKINIPAALIKSRNIKNAEHKLVKEMLSKFKKKFRNPILETGRPLFQLKALLAEGKKVGPHNFLEYNLSSALCL